MSLVLGQLKSIELELVYYLFETCGGGQIYIEIIHDGNRKCETLPTDGYAGETITWQRNKLGSCQEEEFDTNAADIKFRTLTKSTDGFCPLSLTVRFSDQTTYVSEEMDTWNDQNEHIASRKGGNFI